MGSGETRLLLDQAVSSMERIAAKGDQEAGRIASLLKGGKVPERISDPLFGQLLDAASPGNLIHFARSAVTVSEMEGAGADDLARRGQDKRSQMLMDASILENLTRLGFVPSPSQRGEMVRMLAEIAASERPVDPDRPHISYGTSEARVILFGGLCNIVHVLDQRQCAIMLGICKNTSEKFALMERWLDANPGQADVAALFRNELSSVLGQRESGRSDRLKAFEIRKRMDESAGTKVKPPAAEPRPLSPPGRRKV